MSTGPHAVEIRVLGPMQVRRADGGRVQDREWRTGKNAELLRWLALRVGTPVPVEALMEGLWPGVDEARARASLRTAASQLRRILGADVVERTSTGVVLAGAWVDAPTFVELAETVARRRREGRLRDAVVSAREANALYLADVPVSDSSPEAVAEQSAALATIHRRLLGDAAEAAVELGWMRDAVDLGTRLLEADPLSERASRAIMLGYAGIGELHHALREFERCRRVLAEELGVDPSPQTQAAHLQILSSAPPPPARFDFVGRASELSWMTSVLEQARRQASDGEAPSVVVVAGPEGSGRHRLAAVACRRANLPLRDVHADQVVAGSTSGSAEVLVWQPQLPRDEAALTAVLADLRRLGGAAALVLLLPSLQELRAWDHVRLPSSAAVVELEPLLPDDVTALAEQLLGGPLTAGLEEKLLLASEGLPGRVIQTVRQWMSTGQLIATSAGLAPAGGGDDLADDLSGRRALARVLPRLNQDALEALQLAAVLAHAVTPTLLAPLLFDGVGGGERFDVATARARAHAALDQLLDDGLLKVTTSGAEWRNPLVADAVYAWMRPTVRRALHRRVAERAEVPSAERVRHWLQAGERELACVAALDAAAECSALGDHAGARAHLLEVCSLGDLPEADTSDRISVLEQLGDACALLRRPDEACQAYEKALTLARTHGTSDVSRLRRKAESSSDPRALELAPAASRPGRGSGPLRLTGPLASTPSPELAAALGDAIRTADRNRDQRAAVRARLQMATAVHLPRREFRLVHEAVEAALGLRPHPSERLHAAIARYAPAVLLGNAAIARGPLEEAVRSTDDGAADELSAWLLGMRVLVAHDLGEPGFGALWTRLQEQVLSGPVSQQTSELATVAMRVMVERDEHDLAATMAQHLPLGGGQASQLMVHVSRLAAAELAEVTGDVRHAVDLLRSVIAEGRSSGCLIMVPEAAVRLVALEARHDPGRAAASFEVYDEVVGATLGGPREEFWRRVARAALRFSHGDSAGAARTAAQAAELAGQHGLQVLAARARRLRAEYARAGHGGAGLSLIHPDRGERAAGWP